MTKKMSRTLLLVMPLALFLLQQMSVHAAPGEDPIILNNRVEHLNLPMGKFTPSTGLDTMTDIPARMKAKIVRYEAKAVMGAEGVYTDNDVITQGNSKSCVQEVGSNSGASAGGPRFGPGNNKDQVVVLRGDLVNVCR